MGGDGIPKGSGTMANQLPTYVKRTRFEDLGYQCVRPKCWRFVDIGAGPYLGKWTYANIGPCYGSRAELLADVERFYGECYDRTYCATPIA
jgi:hypothetical protein